MSAFVHSFQCVSLLLRIMTKLVDQFEHYLTDSRMSANTIRAYMSSVYTYYNIYGERINNKSLTSYQQYLEKRYSSKTINLRIIAFNKFLTFAGYKDEKLHLIKCQQRNYLDNVISYTDYLRLKGLLQKEKDLKWYFLVWTMAATGVRVSEILQFKVESIFDGVLDIRSKGNKVRRVYIPKTLQIKLLEWLEEEGRLSGPLFMSKAGHPISVRGISKGLERKALKYGFDRHMVHPHAFRHLFAKKFLESRKDLAMLADLLGHESLDTTKIYLRMTSQEQHDIIDEIVEW